MNEIVPMDVMGNPIIKDTLVSVQSLFVVIWRVVAVDPGTDTSPAGVRLAADITLRSPQGIPFANVVRIATPSDQELLEHLSGIRSQ